MRFLSPNGHAIIGVLETVPGRANAAEYDADGVPEYSGGTEVFWDDQKPVMEDGSRIYLCDDGERWRFDQLVREVPEGTSRFRVKLRETVTYVVEVNAEDGDEAQDIAVERWANSKDPTKDFTGEGQGVEPLYWEPVEADDADSEEYRGQGEDGP